MSKPHSLFFLQANKLAAKRKAHDDAEKSKKKKARNWAMYRSSWNVDLKGLPEWSCLLESDLIYPCQLHFQDVEEDNKCNY